MLLLLLLLLMLLLCLLLLLALFIIFLRVYFIQNSSGRDMISYRSPGRDMICEKPNMRGVSLKIT
jgi:hypothetical protein